MQTKFQNEHVALRFATYPASIKKKLLIVRELIFEVARDIKEIGELEETIKWGQPSYLTSQSKSGSLVRIDYIKSQKGKYAVYFHCQTTLVPRFRFLYPNTFNFIGNRAIIFDENDTIPTKELKQCIALAFTYYLK